MTGWWGGWPHHFAVLEQKYSPRIPSAGPFNALHESAQRQLLKTKQTKVGDMLVYCDTNIEDANTGQRVAMQITDNLNIMTFLSLYMTGTRSSFFSVEV